MNTHAAALLLGLAILTGCERDDSKLQEAQRNFDAVVKSQMDGLQWKLDDETAAGIFDERRYLLFRKCHEEPPTHESNKRVCAALQARVAAKEAKDQARNAAEKAAW